MAPADSSPVAAFRPSARDVYFHVVCKWKDYSKDENGKQDRRSAARPNDVLGKKPFGF